MVLAWYCIKKWKPSHGNKCICSYQQLGKMKDIPKKEFKMFSWLPVNEELNYSTDWIIFKYFTNQCTNCFKNVLEPTSLNYLRIRNGEIKLIWSFWNANTGQNTLPFIDLSIWNKTPESLKKSIVLKISSITYYCHHHHHFY